MNPLAAPPQLDLFRPRPTAADRVQVLRKCRYMVHKSQNGEFLGGIDGQLTECELDGVRFYVREKLRGPHFLISANERWGMKAGRGRSSKLLEVLELCAPPQHWERLAAAVEELDARLDGRARRVFPNRQFTVAWATAALTGQTWATGISEDPLCRLPRGAR